MYCKVLWSAPHPRPLDGVAALTPMSLSNTSRKCSLISNPVARSVAMRIIMEQYAVYMICEALA